MIEKKFEEFQYPKGWVNVKVDRDLPIRMARYIPALDKLMPNKTSQFNLHEKITVLSKVNTHIEDKNISIQDRISIITILQYLNEIVNNFNASSSGFLFEYFLASLIHGNINDSGRDAYGHADISSNDNLAKSYNELEPTRFSVASKGIKRITYQIKLYKDKGNIEINMNEGRLCDYYAICIKKADSIEVHILSGREDDTESGYYIGDQRFAVIESDTGNIFRETATKKYLLININKLRKDKFSVSLPISNLDSLVEICGDDVKEKINSLYTKLSELHYDVDSMVTGINKDNKPITIDDAKKNTDATLSSIILDIDDFNII